ncbi:MAG: TetR/AcrR family transcriptional regulator [Chloroflexi bacterium]|nr:TetR/AcrR family transcriptional regulator [Chloroflexota bacterium]
MSEPRNSTHEKILELAEAYFSEKGYTAVRLRDIADEIGIRHTGVYYYIQSKEHLYVEVIERSMARHREGMQAALDAAGPDIRACMHAIAEWLISQPPVNLARLQQSDFPALGEENAEHLAALIDDAMHQPLVEVLSDAIEAGRLSVPDAQLAASTYVCLIEMVHSRSSIRGEKSRVCGDLIEMLLMGWLAR